MGQFSTGPRRRAGRRNHPDGLRVTLRNLPGEADLRQFLVRLVCGLALLMSGAGHAAATVETPNVRATLLAYAPEGVAPGKPVWLGLQLRHRPHWHTYWKNPGDSGLPTALEWTLPPGVAAGDIDWPAPRPLPFGPLVNYGYEGTVLLPVPIAVSATAAGRDLPVSLRADWLVCREECIPESGEFALVLPAGRVLDAARAAFDAAFAARPSTLPAAQATARVEDRTLQVEIAGLPPALSGASVRLLPEVEGLIDHAQPIAQRWRDGRWQAQVPLSPQRSTSPDRLAMVLLADAGSYRIEAPVAGWQPAAPVSAPSVAVPASANPGFVAALALAFAGGVLLNLMPCVFPILSLKVLGFARHAGARRELAAGGLAYTAGVVLSFLALAGVLIALRAGGEQLGWGFQLQAPAFVAALALLFTLIGLNLAGVFEFRGLLPGSVAGWRLHHPAADAFLTGVLAVAVASPCTAPFMGAALGFAFTLPAAQTLLIFTALGLGLAAPYLLASLLPAVARAMPRPGPWMARLRTALAFPMFATVVWLLWVLGVQVGVDGVVGLLGLLVAFAFAVWAWAQPGRSRIGLGVPALALVLATGAWALPGLQAGNGPLAPVGPGWSPWSAERVDALRAAGTPVFVDFTAAWCVTCQFNKRTTLADAAVLADFERAGVALLRADWTARDAAITAALARLGRSGVPVYALYPGGDEPPQVLTEILSPGEIRDALAQLKRKETL